MKCGMLLKIGSHGAGAPRQRIIPNSKFKACTELGRSIQGSYRDDNLEPTEGSSAQLICNLGS